MRSWLSREVYEYVVLRYFYHSKWIVYLNTSIKIKLVSVKVEYNINFIVV